MIKFIKYSLWFIGIILLIWLSLDIQDLEKYSSSLQPASFNAENYAEKFWNDILPQAIIEAPDIEDIFLELNENPEAAFEKYGRKLGISKTHYFMIKGGGVIEKTEEEYLLLRTDDQTSLRILTDFIYGNALRDGSGKVNINDFVNMTDFNAVSVALNKMVKQKVASRLKKSAKQGQYLEFAGVFDLNEENLDLNKISIIPVSVKLLNEK